MSAPDPFSPTPLFSFPLFTSVLAGFDAHRAPLLAEILALKQRHPGVVRSNQNAWHSGPEFLAHKSEHVAWVLQKVIKFSGIALGRYYQCWATSELKLVSCWANVLGPGGWNVPHHHFPTHWSGVFYVSAGEVGTQADDPSGMIEFLNPTPWLSLFGQGGNFRYAPKDGLMLLFPASLYHFVHPPRGGEERVSMAYNFEVMTRSPAPSP